MEWTTILSAGATGAIVSSFLNFFIQLFFEKRRTKETKLNEIKEVDKLILHNLYAPILEVLSDDIVAGDGYEGLDYEQLLEVREIIKNNSHLVDTELDKITYSYEEDVMHMGYSNSFPNIEKFIDTDRKLLDHVLRIYNQKKKSLNFPYDNTYI